jgi:hypothetical protein
MVNTKLKSWNKRRNAMTADKRSEEDLIKTAKARKNREKLKKHPKKWKVHQEKGRIAKQKQRARKKEAAGKLKSPFANKIVFGKGMGKLKKTLPASPEQAVVLLDHALTTTNLRANEFEAPPSSRTTTNEATISLARDFYGSDLCSRPDPSMNGTIWMKNDDGFRFSSALSLLFT